MCRLLFGAEFLDKNTVLTSLIDCNSPLVRDNTMLSVVRVYASVNQTTYEQWYEEGGELANKKAIEVAKEKLAS